MRDLNNKLTTSVASSTGNSTPSFNIVAEHGAIDEEVHRRELQYWHAKLQGAAPFVLSNERGRASNFPRGNTASVFQLERTLVFSLTALAAQFDCDLSDTLYAVLVTLIHRYRHQEDISICVRTSKTADQAAASDHSFSPFHNTVVLRNFIETDAPFSTLLQQIKHTGEQAKKHSSLAFTEVMENAFEAEVEPSRGHLFPLVCNVWQEAEADIDLARVLEKREYLDALGFGDFDLCFNLQHMKSGEICAVVVYAENLYCQSFVERFQSHFMALCDAVTASPDSRINNISFLTDIEKDKLLFRWNETSQAFSSGKSIHQLFQHQVDKTPNATAIVIGDQSLSYSDLNRQANRYAHYLASKGVAPDSFVGICIDRSVELVVAILAILKSGAAYVPLDPDYPASRLAYMQEDADLQIILTQSSFVESGVIAKEYALCVDDEDNRTAVAIFSTENLGAEVSTSNVNNLAYMIYTSGSTGQPKGVMVEHQGLVNLYQWYAKEVLTQKPQRNLLISSLSFDLTQKNILATLISGHTLVIPEVRYFDPEVILNTAKTHQATVLNCAPSAWKSLALAADGGLASLETLVLGGESLDTFDIQQFRAVQPETTLYNSYGPTECSDVTTYHKVTSTSNQECIPIGRGVPNTVHYILTTDMQLAPIGVIGELHIGGVGLARGYLNREQLTQDKFVSNPFSAADAPRLYKTGDLCRYLPDGNIEYIGRADHQVKIRGFRIELSEIEKTLLRHQVISSAVVLNKETESRGKFLVAYVVTQSEVNEDSLRSYLEQALPAYMIPGVFDVLESIPLTPNGKVDRKALLARELPRKREKNDEMSFVQTEVHRIWSQVLGFEDIGIDDDLFKIGGDSIMAVLIFTEINREFELNIHLETLFSSECISIAWFADLIESSQLSQLGEEEYAQLMSQIEGMSEEEIAKLLAE